MDLRLRFQSIHVRPYLLLQDIDGLSGILVDSTGNRLEIPAPCWPRLRTPDGIVQTNNEPLSVRVIISKEASGA